MDIHPQHSIAVTIFLLSVLGVDPTPAAAESPRIQFDMPAVTTAVDAVDPAAPSVVVCELPISTLVASPSSVPPIDHMLIRCRLRDKSPVVDFEPKTELRSEYAGPISVSKKDEHIDSFGFNIDAKVDPYGVGHFGSDKTKKQLDSKEYQQQAPMQAVIASGTTDRGRGVYFKMRWTSTQVLEGEKRVRVWFAVPPSWRGGLIDVAVTAMGIDRPMFGNAKLKPVAHRQFVVAVHRQHDHEAAGIAMKLARLDRELTELAQQHSADRSNAITGFWNKVLDRDEGRAERPTWYDGVTSNQSDPYVDKQIRSLPMPIRVAVLGYADTARELMQLGDAG